MSNISNEVKKSICVLRLSALGDCCHALGTINNIREKLPDTKVTWVIGKTEYQLFKDLDNVDFLIVDKSNLLKAMTKLKSEISGKKFDYLLNMHASMSANLISTVIRAEAKIGFDRARARDLQSLFCDESISASDRQHVADSMTDFLKHIDGKEYRPFWYPLDLMPEEEEIERYIDKSKFTCVISPCSSQRYGQDYNRSWPIKNFIRLIEQLTSEKKIQVILTGGNSPKEIEYSQCLNDHVFSEGFLNLIGNTSIREMASIIKHSQCIIAPDSGPAHIGTVMNKPVIGLYAMSNPMRSGTYHSQDWMINKYPDALLRFEGKILGDEEWGQKIKKREAMQLITVDDVLAKIDKVISYVNERNSY